MSREGLRPVSGREGKGLRPSADAVADCGGPKPTQSRQMRILLLTNEYPPHIYGGAGVHVEYLARELAKLTPVEVRTFGTEDVQQGLLRVRGLYGENVAVTLAPPHLASPLQ